MVLIVVCFSSHCKIKEIIGCLVVFMQQKNRDKDPGFPSIFPNNESLFLIISSPHILRDGRFLPNGPMDRRCS